MNPLQEQLQQHDRPIDPSVVLTDDELRTGGLAPVTTWARTSASKNALRVAKAKEKKAAEGVKQLNVQAPVEAHETLKEIAKASPEVLERVRTEIQRMTGRLGPEPAPAQPQLTDEQRRLIVIGKRVDNLVGWKAWLVRRCLG